MSPRIEYSLIGACLIVGLNLFQVSTRLSAYTKKDPLLFIRRVVYTLELLINTLFGIHAISLGCKYLSRMNVAQLKYRHRGETEPFHQDILDDEEQEGVIAALEGQALAQVSRAKFWVGTGGVLFTSMYIMFSIIQIIEPWTLLHHTPFRLILPLTLTVVAEMLAGGAIALATLSLVKFQFRDAMPDRSRNLLLKSSIYLAVVVFAFWVTSIVRLAISNPDQVKGLRFWRIFWKPLLPGLSVLGVVWTINGLNSIRRELSQLRSAKYTLKQA